MHHDDLFRRVCRTIITKNNNQTNHECPTIYMVVSLMFDCCVSWILLTIYRAFQHDAFAGPCALINLIPTAGIGRGTVESIDELY
jgi:hypothetical protein